MRRSGSLPASRAGTATTAASRAAITNRTFIVGTPKGTSRQAVWRHLPLARRARCSVGRATAGASLRAYARPPRLQAKMPRAGLMARSLCDRPGRLLILVFRLVLVRRLVLILVLLAEEKFPQFLLLIVREHLHPLLVLLGLEVLDLLFEVVDLGLVGGLHLVDLLLLLVTESQFFPVCRQRALGLGLVLVRLLVLPRGRRDGQQHEPQDE